MPTYAELQAETWWGREIVTPELAGLGAELCRRTSRPADAAGTKGNNLHLRGSHRSQEWILNSRYCTSRTYTVQSGLTGEQARHVAGFDFTPGSAAAMLVQCQRLMAALRAGVLEEVREFYGNVDGDLIVDGWNNLLDRAASSDSSHLWHWHLGLDRRCLRDAALMRRIVSIALALLADGEDDDMQVITIAKDAAGQLYACDGMRSRPVGPAAIVDMRTLAAEGRFTLLNADNPRGGWYPGAFGALDTAPAAPTVTLSDAQVAALVGQVAGEALASVEAALRRVLGSTRLSVD